MNGCSSSFRKAWKDLFSGAALLLVLAAPLARAAPYVYVANSASSNVSVINAATDGTVGSPISVGTNPYGVTVSPDGRRVYVTDNVSNGTVSVIDTATDAVVATVPVGNSPTGVAISPDGGEAYVANFGSNNISVIDTATDMLVTTVLRVTVPSVWSSVPTAVKPT